MAQKPRIMLKSFQELKWKTRNLSAEIINMDETTCYFDMTRDNTLSFKRPKNVDSNHTGGRNKRFIVCLAVSLDGRMLKAIIIKLNQRLRTVMAFTPNGLISNDDEERITVDGDLEDESSCNDDYFDMNEDTGDLSGGTLSHLMEETDNVNDDILINDLINEYVNVETRQINSKNDTECNVVDDV